MIESQAYDYLPDMAASQDKLNRLFDLKTDFTFESSEQAWAALLWALEIANAQPFLKAWKTSRQFTKQVQDLLTILIPFYKLKVFVRLRENKSTHKSSQKPTRA